MTSTLILHSTYPRSHRVPSGNEKKKITNIIIYQHPQTKHQNPGYWYQRVKHEFPHCEPTLICAQCNFGANKNEKKNTYPTIIPYGTENQIQASRNRVDGAVQFMKDPWPNDVNRAMFINSDDDT